MKKIIIISIIIGIIITASGILLNSSQEETVEERWLREKVTSGPFSIDKSQYNLGEKIFITVVELDTEDKGQVIFFRPINNTSWTKYNAIEFNGNAKQQFNLYFEPRLSELRKICSTNDLVGPWIVKFIGTEYSDINFTIMNQTSSWDNRIFEPVC